MILNKNNGYLYNSIHFIEIMLLYKYDITVFNEEILGEGLNDISD